MSELNTKRISAKIRSGLLATSCAAALLISIQTSHATETGDETDHPTVWIELGGQLERIDESQTPFAPHFSNSFVDDGIIPAGRSQKLPLYANGFDGAVTFAPSESNWQFSASVRYGRSNSSGSSHNQTSHPASAKVIISIPAYGLHITNDKQAMSRRLGDTSAQTDENHAILDFQAGRDIGIGAFGGNSVIDFGVRFAQFTRKSSAQITAVSGPHWQYRDLTQFHGQPANIHLPTESWDNYHAKALLFRDFHGVGPSIAFSGSAPLIGNPQFMEIGLDFGVNGAVLFGRQKMKGHHQTLDQQPYIPHPYNFIPLVTAYDHQFDPDRAHFVVVPNVGGFAGLSFSYANAKLKFGYRADFFFNAMDGGVDTRKTGNVGFYGPFATVSVGVGG